MRAFLLLLALTAIGLLIVGFAQLNSSLPDSVQLEHHTTGDRLAVSFAHADHINQTCIGCHHNYVDTTGSGLCFDCHITDPDIRDDIEEQFHNLCRDCHVKQQSLSTDHGPTRQCISCHSKDEQP